MKPDCEISFLWVRAKFVLGLKSGSSWPMIGRCLYVEPRGIQGRMLGCLSPAAILLLVSSMDLIKSVLFFLLTICYSMFSEKEILTLWVLNVRRWMESYLPSSSPRGERNTRMDKGEGAALSSNVADTWACQFGGEWDGFYIHHSCPTLHPPLHMYKVRPVRWQKDLPLKTWWSEFNPLGPCKGGNRE